MTIQTLKTISLKRLVGSQSLPDKKGDTKWLALICGVITSAATKTKDTGTHRVYSGDFIARSLVEIKASKDAAGEYVAGRSSEMIVPGVAEDMLDDAGVGAEGTFSNVVLKIGIRADARGRAEYVAEFTLAPTQTSPAEALAKQHAPELLGNAEASQTATPAPATAKKK